MRESLENRREEGQCLRQRSRVLHLPLDWVSPCFVPSLSRTTLTSITRRRPSSTSRSFLLSSNFFICAGGICLTDRRPAPASRAASSVRSRAATSQTGSLIIVYIRFHSTCFQHARDTRYRFHLGCSLSRRNHELEWSSSNVWRGGRNWNLAHVTVTVPAATLNLLRPCHIFCSISTYHLTRDTAVSNDLMLRHNCIKLA
jgi:hypothetical protein